MRFKVERTKEGRIYLDLYNDLINVWRGFSLTEAEARALAREICAQVRTTPAELTADKYTEP